MIKSLHILQLCAMTGAAADNIGGTTVHAALKIGLQGRVGSRQKNIQSQQQQAWAPKRLLIIDEVSMMSVDMLDKINSACRALKGSENEFGGLYAVILFGDFYQFPPIGGEALWEMKNTATICSVRGRRLWKKFDKVIILDEQMRQSEDPLFHALLTRARQGKGKLRSYSSILII